MTSRKALVTGGSRGIGRAVAAALTRSGFAVTIFGRDEEALRRAVADRVAVDFRAVDVTDAPALGQATSETGPFDTLINNAGGAATAPFAKTGRDMFEAMFALNVLSAVTASHACLPAMTASGFGRIVNMASIAGVKAYPYISAYVTAKHALVGLTRAMAVEYARAGITVNAICPGYTDTDLVADGVRNVMEKTGRSQAEARAHFENSNPMGRLIRVEEVAEAALWLVGENAGAVTGQSIVIAGAEQ